MEVGDVLQYVSMKLETCIFSFSLDDDGCGAL